jgi:serpin B
VFAIAFVVILVSRTETYSVAPAQAGPAPAGEFAVKLYQQIAAQPGNLFVSPYSISCALAMCYEGARGETAEEIAATLAMSGDKISQVFPTLHRRFNAPGKPYELSVANGLWVEKAFPVLPDFVGQLQNHYGAGLFNMDFRGAPDPSRQQINAWVEDKTKSRIRDLLPSGTITPETRVVLCNAIYFKGKWAIPFDEENTKPQPFTLGDGKKVQVPLMEHVAQWAGYFEEPDLQGLEVRYKGDELSMLVLLPRDPAGLPALEKGLTAEKLARWCNQLRNQGVHVLLPKFKLEKQSGLKQLLQRLGMKRAFSEAADFSGITQAERVMITDALHKAFVEVNEEGTEAAAATGMVVGATSERDPVTPPLFRADHPFLFLIRDRQTGAILFLGRLDDPSR